MKLMPFEKASDLLSRYGISVAKSRLTKTEVECTRFTEQTGYPVVLKLISSQVIHKTDVGGILTGLTSEKEVGEGFRGLQTLARKLGVSVEGILAQEMLSGFEMIVGGKIDEQFGGVVLVGFGGIYTEVYRDVSLRIAPIGLKEAEEMTKELKAYRILTGFRGRRANLKELAAAIVSASKIVANEEIKEMDINPLFVDEKKAVAADVRIMV